MSEYMPDTEDVRSAYERAESACGCSCSYPDGSEAKAFDRWLTLVKARAYDEGAQDGKREASDRFYGYDFRAVNPYRQATPA